MKIIFMNTKNSKTNEPHKFVCITIRFADQNARALKIEEKVNLTLFINK